MPTIQLDLFEITSRRAKKNVFLQREDVAALDRLYLEAFQMIGEMKALNPRIGVHLGSPKLPTALSESIAALLVPRIFGKGSIAYRPKGLNDLEVGPSGRTVAVKGTGASKWISVTNTDYSADCLIWIDYSRRVTQGAGTIDVWFFDDYVQYWAAKGKMKHYQAVKNFGGKIVPMRVSIKRLTNPASPRN